ncbi:helix-turn-helix transcriptional regulator [Cereibacter sp. SYSU M97828]|nr:helix-turn-helix transcriptional regulator [Cereibacter flavus]
MNHATNLKGEALIVLTAEEYRALIEDAGDAALARDAIERDAGAPRLTAEAAEAILTGNLHPLTAWRKASGLTIAALAEKTGIRAATISEIESGKIDPRLSTVKTLASAIGVDIDDIS